MLMIAIDGNSLLHRAFYAMPLLSNKKGVYTNAIFGFMNMLIRLKKDYEPCSLILAFDRKAPTFRHKAYKDYKATRQKAPEELVPQFDLIKDLARLLEIPTYELDGYEADDILGSLAKVADDNKQPLMIVTGDKDELQLVSDYTSVLLTIRGISETKRYDKQLLMDEYGLTPEQFVDMKGLMGDSSDNIPGVKGIGQKTAIKLLKEYGSLENVLDNIDNLSGKKLKENLTIYRHHALLSKDLATIRRDVPLEFNLPNQPYDYPSSSGLKQFLLDLELNTIIEKLDLESVKASGDKKEKQREKTFNNISSEDELIVFLDLLLKQKQIAIAIGEHLSISWNKDTTYRINFKNDLLGDGIDYHKALNILKPFFESEEIKKLVYDAKSWILELAKEGIAIKGISFDTMIGAYLLDPTKSKYEPDRLLYDYTGIDTSIIDGADLLLLAEAILSKLKELDMEDLYYKIEHPLIEVLADMELTGFKLDRERLRELDLYFTKEQSRLTDEITSLAGQDFNLNSPKQLGEILFEKLGLPVQKKTKTGYSTNIDVLEALQGTHPIIEKIIEYRQVAKIKSTYVDGLIPLISSKDDRIHSSFNQTVTATGRISSTDPNLQNIPVKLETGRRIRQAFISSGPDYTLVAADYSQIELRVLAHISADPTLIDSFVKRQDIHRRTAAEIFNVPMTKVTDEQRERAKAVNFGIIYGISDFGLSRNLKISREEAKHYIDSYLDRYPKIKEYMEQIVEFGKTNGYVKTLYNRRRNLPELMSRNYNTRSFGERIALNMPIQGTAADIIKLSMISVYNELKSKGLQSKLILQVHDELIIDAYKPELDIVIELLKNKMENVVDLSVPLIVEIATADNWYDTK
ncbi:MAG: DNA polymerase I [Clostridiales bacterium]|nr:DNA polymerase I [Clostridiales bacterium]